MAVRMSRGRTGALAAVPSGHLAGVVLRPDTKWQDGKQYDPPDDEINGDDAADGHHGLLQLDERAQKILRMDEDDRLAVRTIFRLAAAEDADAARGKIANGRVDVGDLVADAMNARRTDYVRERRDRRPVPER